MELWKKAGDEIVLAEVDDEYDFTTLLDLVQNSKMMVKAEIIGIRKPRDGGQFILICKAKYTIKWTGLTYKVKEDAYITVYPLLGKMIVWEGGLIDESYRSDKKAFKGDREIGILRADGVPRKSNKEE